MHFFFPITEQSECGLGAGTESRRTVKKNGYTTRSKSCEVKVAHGKIGFLKCWIFEVSLMLWDTLKVCVRVLIPTDHAIYVLRV